MKKPSSKIREEIAKLQDALRAAETREAERIGRVALKAGLGDIEIDEGDLHAAFEDVANKFRPKSSGGKRESNGKGKDEASIGADNETSPLPPSAAQGSGGEA